MAKIEITTTFDAYPRGEKQTFAAGRVLVVGRDVDSANAGLWIEKKLARRIPEPKATPQEKATDE
jgi:hypothetical protein